MVEPALSLLLWQFFITFIRRVSFILLTLFNPFHNETSTEFYHFTELNFVPYSTNKSIFIAIQKIVFSVQKIVFSKWFNGTCRFQFNPFVAKVFKNDTFFKAIVVVLLHFWSLIFEILKESLNSRISTFFMKRSVFLLKKRIFLLIFFSVNFVQTIRVILFGKTIFLLRIKKILLTKNSFSWRIEYFARREVGFLALAEKKFFRLISYLRKGSIAKKNLAK